MRRKSIRRSAFRYTRILQSESLEQANNTLNHRNNIVKHNNHKLVAMGMLKLVIS